MFGKIFADVFRCIFCLAPARREADDPVRPVSMTQRDSGLVPSGGLGPPSRLVSQVEQVRPIPELRAGRRGPCHPHQLAKQSHAEWLREREDVGRVKKLQRRWKGRNIDLGA